MKPVYLSSDNIYSPLAKTSWENFDAVCRGETSVRSIHNEKLSRSAFYASMFDESAWSRFNNKYTRFENICIASIEEATKNSPIRLTDADTLFILSTTKGNVELLENENSAGRNESTLSLSGTAQRIAGHFGSPHRPLVVSNACISGALAVIIARRLLQQGRYRHAVITGADVLSRFIISGFQSLNAMSAEPCKPFDKKRDGINLGECAATMILTTDINLSKNILVNGGASTNDANHISGPSRTGHELAYAVKEAMNESGIRSGDLSFISAHGTATIYNDEMEAHAFAHASLNDVPLHSLKGSYGHTLGAAGVLESVLTCYSLLNGTILPSLNFAESGVSEKVTVNTALIKSSKTHALKTASGFGGCNGAVVYSLN